MKFQVKTVAAATSAPAGIGAIGLIGLAIYQASIGDYVTAFSTLMGALSALGWKIAADRLK